MSTKYERYCTLADLEDIVPEISSYDRKRVLGGFAVHDPEKIYMCADSGTVTTLYRDGVDLGDPQALLADLTEDGEWIYVAATDTLYIYSELEPDANYQMEAGYAWDEVYPKAIARATSMVRSFVRKPVIKRPAADQDVGLRDYDECVIQATATLACSYLVGQKQPELRDQLYQQVFSEDSDPKGLAVMIRDGQFRLWNEAGPETKKGDYREVSLDATTTGGIADIRGSANVAWDRVKVVIETGGTFAEGSASTVTYSVYAASSTGLKTSQVVTAATINGQYQALAHGMEIVFSTGIYVAGDEWEIEMNGQPSETDRRSALISRF